MSRRMFSDEITTSDAFLDMPTESQNLYFHLGMNADDDGFFSNPKMIQRVLGASEDSLKILFAKKFLISFENGICVVKHWRINNSIRKDIYKPTKWVHEKARLFIRKNGTYSLNSENAMKVPEGHFILDNVEDNYVDVTSTSRRLRLGKVSKDKISIELPIWLNKAAWNAWEQHRKEKKKTLTPTSIKLQLKFLEANKEDHTQIIKNSITNGWTGLFPIKKDQFVKKTPPRFIEPSTTKEDNDRRNFLSKQSEQLVNNFQV